MLFTCESVSGDQSLSFTPVLSGEGQRLELPSVLVTGRSRYAALKRAIGRFGKETLDIYRIGKVFKATGRDSITYTYQVRLEYEPWMSSAGIRFIQGV